MRRVSKTLAGALAVFLLAVGLGACGGGSGDSSSSSTEAAQAQTAGGSGGSGSKQSEAKGGEGKKSGSESSSHKGEATEFTPKQHSDAGGGSQQYVQKGGDNSVQEFGKEAEQQELDVAAVALHNFLDARAEGNWAAACDYMSKSIVESFEKLAAQAKQLKETSCAGILEKLTNPAARSAMKQEAEKANVGSLRVEGDRSFVIYKGVKGTILAMPMANEDGDWKVASLAGTPLN
ncbi:MAG TPA: hypothetical protein VJ989_07640 [Solirubrobacterales bacterium]|nr:hypothetical protein [Solirubrobacterales bacterium]